MVTEDRKKTRFFSTYYGREKEELSDPMNGFLEKFESCKQGKQWSTQEQVEGPVLKAQIEFLAKLRNALQMTADYCCGCGHGQGVAETLAANLAETM